MAIENANTIEEPRSKFVKTEFSIAICRHTGDKWQPKTLFQTIFDPGSSIVDSVFDCRLPGVLKNNLVYIPLIGNVLVKNFTNRSGLGKNYLAHKRPE